MKIVGAIVALQRDARTSPAAEIKPHLAVTVAPPFNERETWFSPAHLCHPNCDRLLCRCRVAAVNGQAINGCIELPYVPRKATLRQLPWVRHQSVSDHLVEGVG